ncbi:MAG: type II toxin-antitoxin system PemK/MazF family toxin [Solirubrobacteraceae bacterium]|nr:type II toxin-antitoxin system PemK/MazF family toxin [Solirubrobacteraceae bacterium]
MNRGEIWWYELPDGGRRPGCVLTRQAAIGVLNAVLVAPATRTIRSIPTEVRLGPEDGMPADCVLSFDNLLTVPKVLLTERIAALGHARLDELCAALDIATGC